MGLRSLTFASGCVFFAAIALCGCRRDDVQTIDESAPHASSEVSSAETSGLGSSESASVQASAANEPAPDPTQIREKASLALEEGNDDAAYQLARQAIRLEPDDPQAVFLMARILGRRHRFPEAIQILDQLAADVPQVRLPVMGQTADWMVKFGQWTEAEKRYSDLLVEVPDAILVHRSLARLLNRQGRRVEAAAHLRLLCQKGDIEEIELRQLLIRLHPFAGDAKKDELDPIGASGIAFNEISQNDWASARKRLEALTDIEPYASSLLARIYVNLNDFEALQAWIETSSDANKPYADAWFAKGAAAAQHGDHADAVRCFAEAVLRDATDSHAYSLMSHSLAQLNANEASTEAASRSRSIEQTQVLGAQMAETTERSDAELSKLIDLLDHLHRPLEALRWCGVRLTYARSKDTLSGSMQNALSESIRDRSQRLGDSSGQATQQFLLCGVNLDAL